MVKDYWSWTLTFKKREVAFGDKMDKFEVMMVGEISKEVQDNYCMVVFICELWLKQMNWQKVMKSTLDLLKAMGFRVKAGKLEEWVKWSFGINVVLEL